MVTSGILVYSDIRSRKILRQAQSTTGTSLSYRTVPNPGTLGIPRYRLADPRNTNKKTRQTSSSSPASHSLFSYSPSTSSFLLLLFLLDPSLSLSLFLPFSLSLSSPYVVSLSYTSSLLLSPDYQSNQYSINLPSLMSAAW